MGWLRKTILQETIMQEWLENNEILMYSTHNEGTSNAYKNTKS